MERDREQDNQQFVTREQCAFYRKGYDEENHEQDLKYTKLDTEVSIFKGITLGILGVLVAGFAGVIWSIWSLN